MRRAVRLLVAAITIAGILFLFGFPVRTWFQQQRQMAVYRQQSAQLAAENAKLAARVAQLKTNAQVEQIARQRYGLVMPGEHAYVVVPARSGSSHP